MIRMYRYSGAGNTFITIDGRNVEIPRFRRPDTVHSLCTMYNVDGLMILDDSQKADFRMEYFNRDGSGGMMCGNGGRCIVAFADLLGVKPFHTADYTFEAPDGLHSATILSHLGECKSIRLSMKDVKAVSPLLDGWFADTGTRHFVKMVDDVEKLDVDSLGRRYRFDPAFAPEGTNVDFITLEGREKISIRTFEKGVEAETLACGTGVVAGAVVAAIQSGPIVSGRTFSYSVATRQDLLTVDFRAVGDNSFSDIFLTGPAICEGPLE